MMTKKEALTVIGHPKHHSEIWNSPNSDIYRTHITAFGHPKYLDKATKDTCSSVREAAACFGTKKHREQLKDDPSET